MDWRKIQKNNFTHLESLLDFLEIAQESRFHFAQHPNFVLNLPRRLASKIKKNDLNDPLLKQFIPQTLEQLPDGGLLDPVYDTKFCKTGTLLQKYARRALLVTTQACAMHCRYCFRKNFDYAPSNFEKELEHIQSDTNLEEIILSGGDPLSLSDARLFELLEKLDAIPHLQRIRFHTRFLIGIPERIHEAFIYKLSTLKKQLIFVIHINHLNELDEDIVEVCQKLQKIGIPILTQTVLLKGVNNTVEDLGNLFKGLVNRGIMPYYLHQFDPVAGAMHFEVPLEQGLDLMTELQNQLPGYAIPKYVQEIPDRGSKTLLTLSSLKQSSLIDKRP